MKKTLQFVILNLVLLSCQTEVKFNNPSLQGQRQGEFWRAQNYSAIKTSLGLTIQANQGLETIIMHTTSIANQTFEFGLSNSVYAIFDTKNAGQNNNYNTGTTGDGEIIITDYSRGMVTGTFKFNATNTDPLLIIQDKINFKEGVFYKIPVTVK